ncbi:MAG: hypothetical protein C0404_04580 [Verrucomicrobia bacterium]|nr:hypothetical protein [Verrucomicrobiota bacterium]
MNVAEAIEEVKKLANHYRTTCLWFMREDYLPANREEALRVLDQIERHGDRKAFVEARGLRKWLLQESSAISAK